MPSWAVWKSLWVGLTASRIFSWGIACPWALVLWQHHVLALTSLSASFPRSTVSVLGEHCCAEVVEPWGLQHPGVACSCCQQLPSRQDFTLLQRCLRRELCLFWAGVACHRSTSLTQIWKVVWLREVRGFVWRQGDKPSSRKGNCFLEGAVVD